MPLEHTASARSSRGAARLESGQIAVTSAKTMNDLKDIVVLMICLATEQDCTNCGEAL